MGSNTAHANIAVFVPHNGCPHQCSFCNQRTITGHSAQPSPDDVRSAIETAAAHPKPGAYTELAFFGGSFTAIDRDYMISLLEAAQPYFGNGTINGIRCSTRPDCIDDEVLTILKKYRVTAIELGAQSMRDEVLTANTRGHTADDVRRASRRIKEYGIELGLQMMTGLYMSSDEDDIYTAREIIAQKPATVRIYPTVVLKGTELARLYEQGAYRPKDAEQSAELCARLLTMFEQNDIRVIRVGLHAEKSLEENYIAGAYHPAMRELCESRILLGRMRTLLEQSGKSSAHIIVNPRELSKALGQKKRNIEILKNEGYEVSIKADTSVSESEKLRLISDQ